jgi:Tfp pilus assembly protein PilE
MRGWSCRSRRSRFRIGRGGFTLVEVLVYLLIGVVLVSVVYRVLISQNRLYVKQRELIDVRGTLSTAAAVLAWELRQASAAGGDLYSIGPSSFSVRSIQGVGIVCAANDTVPNYGLWRTTGEFYATTDDSALVYAAGSGKEGDDGWRSAGILELLNPTTGQVPACAWPAGVAPDLVVKLAGDLTGIYPGGPLRSFRRVEYGLFQDGGRWWLGARVGAAESYEKLTGPVSSPADGGLMFTYYDQNGAATLDPTQVAEVQIVIRAESVGKIRQSGGQPPGFQRDTVATRVSLRG